MLRRLPQTTRLVLAAVVAVTGVAFGAGPAPVPASAQRTPSFQIPEPDRFPFDRDRPADNTFLGVRVHLQAAGGDVLQVYGTEEFDEDDSRSIARSVGDALSIDRRRSEVSFPDFSSEYGAEGDGGDHPDTDTQIDSDDRLVRRQGADWIFEVDTRGLLRTASLNGFSGLELGVCPTDGVEVLDESMRPPEDVNRREGCRWWREPVLSRAAIGPAPLRVRVVERPNSDDYWRLVGALAAGFVLLTVVTSGVTLVARRRFLRHLGGANLAVSLVLLVLAITGAAITAGVLATLDSPITDFVLDRDLKVGGHVMSVVAPAFLAALPLFVPAVLLVRTPPPLGIAESGSAIGVGASAFAPPGGAGGVPGVPSWLSASEAPGPVESVAAPPWSPPHDSEGHSTESSSAPAQGPQDHPKAAGVAGRLAPPEDPHGWSPPG